MNGGDRGFCNALRSIGLSPLHRTGRALVAGLVLALPLGSPHAGSEVFRWLDERGGVHYGDHAGRGARKLEITSGYIYSVVKKVFDGDTLLLADGERVRLLGINTPEVESPKKAGEPGGEEARAWLAQRIESRRVRLETDVTRRDSYERLLAHVFTEDDRHINLELIEKGLATLDVHPPNLKYSAAFLQAQNRAERDGRGIWRDPAYAPKAIRTLTHSRMRGWQRLRGTVKSVHPGRFYQRLVFAENIDARIPKQNLPLFADLKRYVGKEVEVRGWPSRRKNHFSILVRHPSALLPLPSR